MFPFYTPWKSQKTRDFLTFWGGGGGGGGTEREHWLQMSYQNNGGIKYN